MLRILFISVLAMSLSACGGESHEHHASPSDMDPTTTEVTLSTPDAFKAQLTTALQSYFDLSTSLIETNAADAQTHAENFALVFESVDGSVLSGQAAEVWNEHAEEVKKRAHAIHRKLDVEEQRYEFEYLSAGMIMIVKNLGVDQTVYEQTCPMVRGGSANWLAPQEEILNPYHGSRMLRCGAVVSIIS